MIKFINVHSDEVGEIFNPFVDDYEIGGIYTTLEKLLEQNDFVVFYTTKSKQIIDIEKQIKFDENYFVTELVNNSLKKLVAHTLYQNGKKVEF